MLKVSDYITRATELTALGVWRIIQDKGFTPQDLLTEEESKIREKLIDQTGVDAMYSSLLDIPFVLRVVGSEGRKHIHQYGEAFPALEGVFGKGRLKLDCVNDVVEGSKAAKLNSPGAISVIAVSSHGGLMPTPDNTDYMDKLFGPPQLKGKISIDKPVEENLSRIREIFKVKPPEITLVMMDRDRNAHLINGATKFGAKMVLLNAGDLLPAVLACMDPKKHGRGIYLVMGIGGFEEGVIAAVAAKNLGAVAEGRAWFAEKPEEQRFGKVWAVDDLVPGKNEDCLVSISFITTDNKWFDVRGVEKNGQSYKVTTLTVDSAGVNIKTRLHQ